MEVLKLFRQVHDHRYIAKKRVSSAKPSRTTSATPGEAALHSRREAVVYAVSEKLLEYHLSGGRRRSEPGSIASSSALRRGCRSGMWPLTGERKQAGAALVFVVGTTLRGSAVPPRAAAGLCGTWRARRGLSSVTQFAAATARPTVLCCCTGATVTADINFFRRYQRLASAYRVIALDQPR